MDTRLICQNCKHFTNKPGRCNKGTVPKPRSRKKEACDKFDRKS